jgi:hypothetical protein
MNGLPDLRGGVAQDRVDVRARRTEVFLSDALLATPMILYLSAFELLMSLQHSGRETAPRVLRCRSRNRGAVESPQATGAGSSLQWPPQQGRSSGGPEFCG